MRFPPRKAYFFKKAFMARGDLNAPRKSQQNCFMPRAPSLTSSFAFCEASLSSSAFTALTLATMPLSRLSRFVLLPPFASAFGASCCERTTRSLNRFLEALSPGAVLLETFSYEPVCASDTEESLVQTPSSRNPAARAPGSDAGGGASAPSADLTNRSRVLCILIIAAAGSVSFSVATAGADVPILAVKRFSAAVAEPSSATSSTSAAPAARAAAVLDEGVQGSTGMGASRFGASNGIIFKRVLCNFFTATAALGADAFCKLRRTLCIFGAFLGGARSRVLATLASFNDVSGMSPKALETASMRPSSFLLSSAVPGTSGGESGGDGGSTPLGGDFVRGSRIAIREETTASVRVSSSLSDTDDDAAGRDAVKRCGTQ